MKKLEIIIKPEKLEDLKGVLDTEEVNGLNIVNSMGYGNQIVETDEVAPKLIDKIVDEINTGHFGDGKIFVYDVEDAIRIRTGEHGTKAL